MTAINSKILLPVLLLIGLAFGIGVFADDSNPQSYIFYVYYDKGKLVADRDFVTPFDVVPMEYQAQQGSFKGEVYSFKDQVLASFNFELVQGKNQVLAPYFFNTKKIVFYDQVNQQILYLDVSTHSFCNENGVCDSGAWEDNESCPADCKVEPSTTTLPDEGDEGLSRGIWFGSAGVAMAVVIWFAWLIIKKRRAGMMPPPTLPPTVQPPTQ